jgi:hypothetical protein
MASDKLQTDTQRLRDLNRRIENAAERVRSKREEIAKIEAAGRSSAVPRSVLATFEQELAHHCEYVEYFLSYLEETYPKLSDD